MSTPSMDNPFDSKIAFKLYAKSYTPEAELMEGPIVSTFVLPASHSIGDRIYCVLVPRARALQRLIKPLREVLERRVSRFFSSLLNHTAT